MTLICFELKTFKELRNLFGKISYFRDALPNYPYKKWLQDLVGVNFSYQDALKYLYYNHDPFLTNFILRNKGSYYIIFKSGDKKTFEHELKHFNFFKNERIRKKVLKKWNSLPSHIQSQWYNKLTNLGYNQHVLLDEYQAFASF
jgi:hypothetical protein